MQSSFLAIWSLFVLVQTTLVSSHKEGGYNCDNVYIPKSRLTKVVEKARATPKDLRLSTGELYAGPPFRKSYLLWPVYAGTEHNSKATDTPYRVVLDSNFQVFSVIMKLGPEQHVKECRLKEDLNSLHSYKCGKTIFPPDILGRATLYVCNRITEIASIWTPSRYNGPAYEGSGEQLYITPIISSFDRRGPFSLNDLVVFNTKCTVVGVVTNTGSGLEKCQRLTRKIR